MKIKHKIEPETPDDVCELCQQQINGVCRALQVPHTKKEEIRDQGPMEWSAIILI